MRLRNSSKTTIQPMVKIASIIIIVILPVKNKVTKRLYMKLELFDIDQ